MLLTQSNRWENIIKIKYKQYIEQQVKSNKAHQGERKPTSKAPKGDLQPEDPRKAWRGIRDQGRKGRRLGGKGEPEKASEWGERGEKKGFYRKRKNGNCRTTKA